MVENDIGTGLPNKTFLKSYGAGPFNKILVRDQSTKQKQNKISIEDGLPEFNKKRFTTRTILLG
ncbi:hypothetical protein AKO1_008286, partial [Acrasis kona]